MDDMDKGIPITTEQLQELLSVAEHVVGPFQSALHEATWREEFRQRFTPATCAELVREVIRLRKEALQLRRDEERASHNASLMSQQIKTARERSPEYDHRDKS